MRILTPAMVGIIERRILVNYHVDPAAARKLLPPGFRLKLVKGRGIAGICLIRFRELRPRGWPAAWGLASENAAHRIAVEWGENGQIREGVYIPRRDTSSRLQALAGGRIFPGRSYRADFTVNDRHPDYQLQMRSRDGEVSLELRAHRTDQLPQSSRFASLAEASDFFARGSAGYSATKNPDCCDGVELCTTGWEVEPLEVEMVRSSFLDEPGRFPKGTVGLDCALLMRNIAHEWRVLPRRKGRI